MKKTTHFLMHHNLLFTLLMLLISTILCFLLFNRVPENQSNVTLIYILALILISKHTSGYRYGIGASFFCVVMVNYCFTYPYYELNFTLTGYPITFIEMLSITSLTCATTTHMIQQNNMLAEQDKQLLEAEKEKVRANLLRAVSHDLRTPLTSIISVTSNLQENIYTVPDEEKKELIKDIYNDAYWLLGMVENLLTITRINNITAKVKKNMELIEEVVSEAVTRIKKRIPDMEVNISIPEDFLMIPMDAILIEQVIINLLENAFVHSKSSKPIDFKITSTVKSVIFQIRDYGIGIDETRIEDIFNGIPTHDGQMSDSNKGMQIGLSICKTIILAHDGIITANNHSNGAEFTFILPKENLKNE